MNNSKQIPKIIHYCWFGGKEKPELVEKCIASWKKFLPDYELREWNNDDLKQCTNIYVQQALEHKKWAFISDYFRLYALYNFGGIYLDADNEILKSFNIFLDLEFFTGYEYSSGGILPFTAVVGAQKNNKIIKDLLYEYNNISFINNDGSLNTETNTSRVSKYFEKIYGLKFPYDGKRKFFFEDKAILFPFEYFCPKYLGDSKYKITKNTYAIHHFASSWVDDVRNFWNLKLPFGVQFKFYICKEETKKTNILPKNEKEIIKLKKNKRRYIVITFVKNNQ